MNPNAKFSEQVAILGTVDPQLLDDGAANSDFADLSKFDEVAFVLSVGATDTTVDMKLQEDTAGDGNAVADISGKAITQLTGAAGDNKQAVISIRAAELTEGKKYVRAVVTAGDGTEGANVHVLVLGIKAAHSPASDNDIASVAQIVD